jgi:hypothetical protein
MSILYSYKMTHDTGFAPNPFHGIITLATCKPLIREHKQPGMYVAGFTSKKLCGDKVGQERLVYIMEITEKITFDSYYKSIRFKNKIASNESRISQMGDNIYFLTDNKYQQSFSYFHTDKDEMDNDLKSDQVLLSNNFFYLGVGAIPIDNFKINIPRTQTAHGVKTTDKNEIQKLWKYLESNFKKNQLTHPPHSWNVDKPYN